MKLRRAAVIENLGRPRLGLTERQIAAVQRPRTGLVVALGAIGFTPVHRNDGQGLEPRPSHPTEERTLDGPSAI